MRVIELQNTEWIDGVAYERDGYMYIIETDNGKTIESFDSDVKLNRDEIKLQMRTTLEKLRKDRK